MRFGWHFCGEDFFLQFLHVRAVFALAEFFLNRFDLLIQIVFALTFVHLAFDAPTDAFFDLKDVDFDFHLAHDVFKTGFDAAQFEHFLLDFKFNRQMRDDGVRQMRTVINGRQ